MTNDEEQVTNISSKQKAITREYEAFKFELGSTNESGEFSGYAAVFGNRDDGDDIIEKGAFAKTIINDFDRIKILSQHDDFELPIGKPLELREDDKGLYIRGKISNTQKGRDIQTLLKDGVLNELSIGYDIITSDFDNKGIRHLREIRLWEVSIVNWAMNDQAKINEVKSLAETLKKEVKSGNITQSRLDTLKPFIEVIKELVNILSPFWELTTQTEQNLQNNIKQLPQKNTKKTKMSEIIFEIIPTPNRR